MTLLRVDPKNAWGTVAWLPVEQDVMVQLKQLMQDDRMYIPFERELLNGLDVERYELTGLSPD